MRSLKRFQILTQAPFTAYKEALNFTRHVMEQAKCIVLCVFVTFCTLQIIKHFYHRTLWCFVIKNTIPMRANLFILLIMILLLVLSSYVDQI